MTEIQMFKPDDTIRFEDEAALYACLAAFFLSNPEKNMLDAAKAFCPEAFAVYPEIAAAVTRIKQYADAADKDNPDTVLELKRDWTKLFRGISPDYGPTAPYGLLFIRGNTGEMMADMAALYIDGGYDGYQSITDRIDYIGTGFDYLKTVSLQLVHASETKDISSAVRLKLCRDTFISKYFGAWVPEFAARARKHAATEFYNGVLDLAVAVLAAFCGGSDKVAVLENPLLSEAESREIAAKEDAQVREMVNAASTHFDAKA